MANRVDGSITIGTKIDQSGATKGISKLKGTLKSFAATIGLAFSTAAVKNFADETVDAASKVQNTLQGVKSIVEGQGRSYADATKFLQEYVSDGLVPMNEATTAYKNLAARGYDDSQIQSVMNALKDSAAFGRQASLTMGAAISSATEGLKNENSILVDNAGVTKNVSKMWDEYAESIGTTAAKLTQQQKIQAEVNGILKETRFQTGDAAKVAGMYSGQVSQLSFNYNNLKVAIGKGVQVLYQQAMPVINTIIVRLTDLANIATEVISSLFGGSKQSKTNNQIAASATAAAEGESALADATADAAKEAKRAVAGFDDLNTLASDTADASSVAADSGISVPTVNDTSSGEIAVGENITVSPKAKKIAGQIKEFISDIRDMLDRFSPLLEGIATGFLVAFGFSWLSSALSKVKSIGVISGAIDAIKIAVGAAGKAFAETKNPIKAATKGFSSLGKSFKTYMRNLSGAQKAAVSVVALTAAFVTAKSAAKDYFLGTKDLGTALLNIIPVCAAVGVAMYSMLGPWGLALAAVAAVAGALVGYNEAQKELEREQVEDYFDGVAISAENLTGILSPMTEQMEAFNQKIEDHKATTDELVGDYNAASDSLDMLYTQLQTGVTSVPESVGTIYDNLIALGDTLKKSTDEDTQYYYSSWQQIFTNVGTLSSTEQAEILSSIIQLGNDKKAEIDRIEQEITTIHETARARNVGNTVTYTAEELAKLKGFQDQLDALMAIERNKQANIAEYEAAQLYEDIKSGRVKVTQDGYQELLDTVKVKEEESVELAKENQNQSLADADAYWEQAKIIYAEGSAELSNAEDNYYKMREQANSDYAISLQNASDIANSTREMLKESLQQEQDAYAKTAETIEDYNYWLEKANRYAQANTQGLGNYSDELENARKHLAELREELSNNELATKDWRGNWKVASEEYREANQKAIDAISKAQEKSVENFVSYGVNSAQGLVDGYKKKYGEIQKSAAAMFNKSEDALHEAGDFGSPSKKMKKYGIWTAEGFAEGIEDRESAVVSSFTNLFRKIQSKTQTFCDNFRGSINGLMSNMTESLNGVYIGADNKIRYNAIPRVKVPALATGAVIPPNQKFLAMLGDQTHGRNLEAPESLIRQIVREETAGAYGDMPREVVLELNGRELARASLPYLDKERVRVSAFAK